MRPSYLRPLLALIAAAVAAGVTGCTDHDNGSGDAQAVVAAARLQDAPRLAGCPVFPADNYWNTDISRLPVHPRSRAWLSHMSTDRDLHPDFGPSYGDGPNYGIPITVVTGDHPTVPVQFRYAGESD